jgi:hypothetical protein
MNYRVSLQATAFCCICLLFSCTSESKISISNINDSGTLPTGSFIYALPQTVIDICITAEEVTIIPGPFRQYADKYLGIKNVPDRKENNWIIRDIHMSSHLEADPDYVYTVRGLIDLIRYPDLIRLVEDSLILDSKSFSYNQVFYNTFPPVSYDPYYTDISVKRNFEAEKDVEVSLVMPDTNYSKKLPRKTILKEKTLEQKAEEAANFLIKLKKRRFKLVAGQYEYMPEGTAMENALKELSRLEEEYLSLFIGKRVTSTWQKAYHYTPVPGKETNRIVLLRFSDSDGYLDIRDTKGIPVMLELTESNKTKGLEQSQLPLKQLKNVILYRIADQVSVKLISGELIRAEGLFPVFQSGVIVPLNLGEPVTRKK